MRTWRQAVLNSLLRIQYTLVIGGNATHLGKKTFQWFVYLPVVSTLFLIKYL